MKTIKSIKNYFKVLLVCKNEVVLIF